MPNGPYRGPCEVRVVAPGVSGDELHKHRRQSWISSTPTRSDWLSNRGSWYALVAGGCWLWRKGTRNGYPVLMVSREKRDAALIVYRQCIGEIPRGEHLARRCRNPLCVNPEHLEPRPKAQSISRLQR